MQDFLVFEAEVFKLYVLVLVRVSGLLIAAPVLGSRNFPVLAKIGFAATLAALVTPVLPQLAQPLPDQLAPYALLAVGEMMIGLIMGFVMTLVFGAIQVAGQIMDMQSGFGLINVFNPAMETQFPIFGFFLFILAVLFLLATNGHHVMLRALMATFEKIPIGGFVGFRPEFGLEVTRWASALFVDGMVLAAPVAAALMLAYIVLGLLGRLVPQIQLFVVGFPITIAASLTVTALSVHIYIGVLNGMFTRMFRQVAILINSMS